MLLNGAMIRNSDFHQVVMRGVEIVDTTIDGEIQNLVINGVDVAPLVEAELDKRYPDRPKFRPTTAAGFREAWDLNERLWAATVERARMLDPEQLHESVNGEWSFIQTLRHLAFASESWVGRCILGDPRPLASAVAALGRDEAARARATQPRGPPLTPGGAHPAA